MVSSVPAGLVIVSIAVLCLGYLLPYVARQRNRSGEIPVEDRFSVDARVIEPATEPATEEPSSVPLLSGSDRRRTQPMQRPATSRPAKPVRPIMPPQPAKASRFRRENGRAGRVQAKDRQGRETKAAGGRSEAKPAKVQVPEHLRFERERARAVRVCLSAAFALLTIGGVTLAITSGLTVWAGIVCGSLTIGVLTAGSHAAAAERQADARAAAQPASVAPAAVPSVGGERAASVRGAGVQVVPDAAAPASKAKPARDGADSSVERTAALPDGQRREAAAAKEAAKPAVKPARETSHLKQPREAPAREVSVAKPARDAKRRVAGSKRAASAEDGGSARRPGISGRVRGGQTVYHLPDSVEIEPLEDRADEASAVVVATPPAGPRRFTTARPTDPVASTGSGDSGGEGSSRPKDEASARPKPKQTLQPGGIPAPTYAMMSGAPRWEPKALTAADYDQAEAAAAAETRRAAAAARAEGLETVVTGEIRIPGRVVFAEDAIDLDRAIRARRRAAGD